MLLLGHEHFPNRADRRQTRSGLRHFRGANGLRDFQAIKKHAVLCTGAFLFVSRRLQLDARNLGEGNESDFIVE